MKVVRVILYCVIVLVFLFLAVPFLLYPGPFRALIIYLPSGWWLFLQRNLSQITINWSLIFTAALCSLLIIFVGHWFMVQIREGWKWRWTLCAYAAVWVLFAIAFGAGGLYRHTSWLLSDDHPWYVRRKWHGLDVSYVENCVRINIGGNDGDYEKCRREFLGGPFSTYGGGHIYEDFEVMIYGRTSNKITAWLVIPRGVQNVPKALFKFGQVEDKPLSEFGPLSELPMKMSTLEKEYAFCAGL
jgi:hypothetical protein